MASSHPAASEERSESCSKRTNSWDSKHSKAIVYDPLNHEMYFETEEALNKTDGSFQVHLPRWRNRVDIYLDDQHKAGFVTSIDLGTKLGVAKNLKRRLRYDYTVLHIKKPGPRIP